MIQETNIFLNRKESRDKACIKKTRNEQRDEQIVEEMNC